MIASMLQWTKPSQHEQVSYLNAWQLTSQLNVRWTYNRVLTVGGASVFCRRVVLPTRRCEARSDPMKRTIERKTLQPVCISRVVILQAVRAFVERIVTSSSGCVGVDFNDLKPERECDETGIPFQIRHEHHRNALALLGLASLGRPLPCRRKGTNHIFLLTSQEKRLQPSTSRSWRCACNAVDDDARFRGAKSRCLRPIGRYWGTLWHDACTGSPIAESKECLRGILAVQFAVFRSLEHDYTLTNTFSSFEFHCARMRTRNTCLLRDVPGRLSAIDRVVSKATPFTYKGRHK